MPSGVRETAKYKVFEWAAKVGNTDRRMDLGSSVHGRKPHQPGQVTLEGDKSRGCPEDLQHLGTE